MVGIRFETCSYDYIILKCNLVVVCIFWGLINGRKIEHVRKEKYIFGVKIRVVFFSP